MVAVTLPHPAAGPDAAGPGGAQEGFDPETARVRSVLAYAAYLGHAQLAAVPNAAPTPLRRYVESVVGVLIAPTCPSCSP